MSSHFMFFSTSLLPFRQTTTQYSNIPIDIMNAHRKWTECVFFFSNEKKYEKKQQKSPYLNWGGILTKYSNLLLIELKCDVSLCDS